MILIRRFGLQHAVPQITGQGAPRRRMGGSRRHRTAALFLSLSPPLPRPLLSRSLAPGAPFLGSRRRLSTVLSSPCTLAALPTPRSTRTAGEPLVLYAPLEPLHAPDLSHPGFAAAFQTPAELNPTPAELNPDLNPDLPASVERRNHAVAGATEGRDGAARAQQSGCDSPAASCDSPTEPRPSATSTNFRSAAASTAEASQEKSSRQNVAASRAASQASVGAGAASRSGSLQYGSRCPPAAPLPPPSPQHAGGAPSDGHGSACACAGAAAGARGGGSGAAPLSSEPPSAGAAGGEGGGQSGQAGAAGANLADPYNGIGGSMDQGLDRGLDGIGRCASSEARPSVPVGSGGTR